MAASTMGLIGEISADLSPSFLYDFITPDFSRQPKRPNNPFDGTGDWPSTIAIFQQRRVYASTDNQPSTLFFSHIGFFDDFSLTEFPDGSFELELDSKYFDRINHMIPMQVGLLLFSERDVYLVTSAGNSGITLSTAVSRNELESGARRDVQPINVLKNVVFMSNLDGSPRALAPTPQSDSQLITQDLALLNQHLFDKSDVIAWTYAGRNDRIIWAVRADGVLLSCTYAPEHQVSAWCKHSTRGRFLDVQAVYEPDADTVYMVVERGQHSFIEYFPAPSKCSELGTAVDAAVETPKILVRRELEIADYVDGVKQGAPGVEEASTFFEDYTGIGAYLESDDVDLQTYTEDFICTDGGVYKIVEVMEIDPVDPNDPVEPPVDPPNPSEDPMFGPPEDICNPGEFSRGHYKEATNVIERTVRSHLITGDTVIDFVLSEPAPAGGCKVTFTMTQEELGAFRGPESAGGWYDFTNLTDDADPFAVIEEGETLGQRCINTYKSNWGGNRSFIFLLTAPASNLAQYTLLA